MVHHAAGSPARRRVLVALGGLEPPTQGLGCPRSIHLNYRANAVHIRHNAPKASVLDQRENGIPCQPLATLERRQFDQKRKLDDLTPELLHQIHRRRDRPARR